MATTINATDKNQTAIQFKGKTFSLTVLQVFSNDLDEIKQQLENLIAQAPKMFHQVPVAIDLDSATDTNITLELSALIQLLQQHQIIPLGITGGTTQQQQAAITAGLAVLPASKNIKAVAPKPATATVAAPAKVSAPITKTKVIHQPIRSGQQIYAKDADLIVLAAVSHGAEVIADGNIHVYGSLHGRAIAGAIADGNIHVYGSLHGRAIAGASGDLDARIFCNKLDAELISIAGIYSLSDDYTSKKSDTPMQVYLENNRLLVAEL